MSKIGIFGGTFNPIHIGHTMLAEYCKKEIGLDRVILIPTYTPPHKSGNDLAPTMHRLKMCELAVLECDGFEVSDIEIQRMGKSYTFETLTSLKNTYPNDEIFLIVGADMFLTLDKWKKTEIIFSKAKIAAVPRNSSDCDELSDFYNRKLRPMGANAVILPKPVLTVSSTFIRENINKPNLVKSLLCESVYEYIVKNNLYRK